MKAMRPPAAFSGGGAPSRMLPTYQAATGSVSRRLAAGSRAPLGIAAPRAQRAAPCRQPRKPGVEPRQIGKRDADAAEPHRQPGRSRLGQHQRRRRACRSRATKRLGPDLVQHLHRRHVERDLQRLADRHRALEGRGRNSPARSRRSAPAGRRSGSPGWMRPSSKARP